MVDLSGLIFWPAGLGATLFFLALILVPEPWKGIAAGIGFFLGMFSIPLLVEPHRLRDVIGWLKWKPSGPWTLEEEATVLVVALLLLGFLALLAWMVTYPFPAP